MNSIIAQRFVRMLVFAYLIVLTSATLGFASTQGGQLVVQTPHMNKIRAICWSMSGKYLATAAEDRSVDVWDIASGLILSKLQISDTPVVEARFADDDTRLIARSKDDSIRLWNPKTAYLVAVLASADSASAGIVTDRSGSLVGFTSERGDVPTAQIFDTQTGRQVLSARSFPTPDPTIAIRSDGRYAAIQTADHVITIFPLRSKAPPIVKEFPSAVAHAIFLTDGRLACAENHGNTIYTTAITGTPQATFSCPGPLIQVQVSPNGEDIAATYGNKDQLIGSAAVWRLGLSNPILVTHGVMIRQWEQSPFAYSQDGKWLAYLTTGSRLQLFKLSKRSFGPSFAGGGEVVQFSPRGDRLAVETGSRLELIDTAAGRVIGHLPTPDDNECFGFSPDGQLTASVNETDLGTVRINDTLTGDALPPLPGHAEWVELASCDRLGRTIATVSISTPNDVMRLWNERTGELIRSIKIHGAIISELAFSNDGSLVICGGSNPNKVRFIDARTGIDAGWDSTSYSPVPDMSNIYSYPGDLFATLSGSTIELRKNRLGEMLASTPILLQAKGRITCAGFSRDGATIAAADANGRVYLWSTGGKALGSQDSHCVSPRIVTFSHAGNRLVVVNDQGFASLFTVPGLRFLTSFGGATVGTIMAAGLDQAGSRLALAFRDGRIEITNTHTHVSQTLSGPDAGGSCVAVLFGPKGSNLAAVYASTAISVQLWDLSGRRQHSLFRYKLDTDVVLGFDSSGKYLAAGGLDAPGPVQVCDTTSAIREDLQTQAGFNLSTVNAVSGAAVRSPSGRYVIQLDERHNHRRSTHSLDPFVLPSGEFPQDAQPLVLFDNLRHTKVPVHDPNGDVFAVFSTDDRYLLTGPSVDILSVGGDIDTAFRVWSLPDGHLVRILRGHASPALSVTYEPHRRRWISAGSDNTIRIWDMDTGRPAATMVPVGLEDFVTYTDAGYYICSRDGSRGVAFRVDGNALPFDQFDLSLHRPDKVLASLSPDQRTDIQELKGVYDERIRRMHLAGISVGLVARPSLKLKVQPAQNAWSRKLILTVSSQPADHYSQVVRVFGYDNGVPLFGRSGAPMPHAGTATLPPVMLSAGENSVELYAVDDQGRTSLTTAFRVRYARAERPVVYVMAIGVHAYPGQPLKFPAHDATVVSQRFRSRGASSHVVLLTDGAATHDQVVRQCRRLLAKTTEDDEVIILLAGHGTLDANGIYYYCMYDTDLENPHHNGLSYDQIEDLFDGVRARKRVVVLDTCFSGERDPVTRIVDEEPFVFQNPDFVRMQQMFIDLRRQQGEVMITASSGMDVAEELPSLHHGILTYAFLQALSSGVTTVAGLREYVLNAVPQLSGGSQLPTIRNDNTVLDWDVLSGATVSPTDAFDVD